MKVAHFDCFSGISGDMVLGAVLDVGVPAEAIRAALASLQLPIELEIEKVKRCGFACTHATVHAKDQEDYRFLPDVEAILDRAAITDAQRELAKAIFRKVALAEAAVHGMPLEKVHFHEVGALDSIADIVGAAVGLTLLGVEKFTSSAVPTGSGTIKCAHGIMPVPTPGTLELLKGVPLAKSVIKTELTTPTGAAILTSVVREFTDTPAMTVERIGTGCGTKDFIEQPNILRLLIGTQAPLAPGGEGVGGSYSECDTVTVLETNLDDCTPEVVGYCFERLLNAGALDVFAVPISMKKNRPGVILTVIAMPMDAPKLEDILFRETGTFGIRRSVCERSKLQREALTVATPWGEVKAKRGWRGSFAIVTPEYEDCARVAKENGVSLREVYDAINVL